MSSQFRGRELFSALASSCEEAFSYLVSEYGYRIARASSTDRGFQVDFQGDGVGVRVSYQFQDLLAVYVCLLDGPNFPGSPGEIRPGSRLAQFSLGDIEAVAGREVNRDEAEEFATPTVETLERYSGRLRAAASEFLAGDMSMVPKLRNRILRRAEAAARIKWGDKASDYGW